MKSKRRFVVDTNVLVSAMLLPGSVPNKAFNRILDVGTLLLSVPALDVFSDVVARPRFDKYLRVEKRTAFLNTLMELAELIVITECFSVCRDPRDDKFLELAVNGKADCLVSGDADLLVLNPFRGIAILKPQEFLDYV